MGMRGGFVAVSADEFARLLHDPDSVADFLYPDDGESEPPNSIDIDKAWHGIHYLLTGEAEGGAEPGSLAVLGGEEFGEDVGYGPARFLTPSQVAAVSQELAKHSTEELTQRYRPQDMDAKQIYPDIWVRDGDEGLEYLLEYYRVLADFYRDAASRGDAVIQWLS
jgi:hypothetical protein